MANQEVLKEEVQPVDIKVREEIIIDESNILGELARHSSKFLYWGSMWAKAARKKRLQRLKVNALQAKLSNEFRKQMSVNNPGLRVTDSMITAYLNDHPENIQEMEELIKTEYMEEVLDVTRDAMKARGLALGELARQNREEQYFGNELKNMEKEYEERLKDKKGKKKLVKETEESK